MRYILTHKRKICFILLILVLTVFAFYYIYNNSINHDALMIKQKYEFYNNQETSNGDAYPTIYLKRNMDIINVTLGTALEKLESDSGILFIGEAKDFSSRKALPVILQAAEENEKEVLYLDGNNLRDEYVLKNKEVKKDKGASKNYYKLLELLGDSLNDYVLEDEDGESYPVGEKRLEYPTTVFFSDGKIKGVHVGIENNFDEKEKEKLLKIYNGYIKQLSSNVCTINTSC